MLSTAYSEDCKHLVVVLLLLDGFKEKVLLVFS